MYNLFEPSFKIFVVSVETGGGLSGTMRIIIRITETDEPRGLLPDHHTLTAVSIMLCDCPLLSTIITVRFFLSGSGTIHYSDWSKMYNSV